MIWNDTTKELAKKLNTNFVTGLTEEAAAQLLIETGPNKLPVMKKKPIWKIVLAHFIEPFVLVLIALAIIATVIGQWQEALVVFFNCNCWCYFGYLSRSKSHSFFGFFKEVSFFTSISNS